MVMMCHPCVGISLISAWLGPKSITGDLAALLDHLKVTKAVFIGHEYAHFVQN